MFLHFANASGGDVIFEMKAQGGHSLTTSWFVALVDRRRNSKIGERPSRWTRSSHTERQAPAITLASGVALVIRVPRRWMPPHRVKQEALRDSVLHI
jgi:hypothetical protein